MARRPPSPAVGLAARCGQAGVADPRQRVLDGPASRKAVTEGWRAARSSRRHPLPSPRGERERDPTPADVGRKVKDFSISSRLTSTAPSAAVPGAGPATDVVTAGLRPKASRRTCAARRARAPTPGRLRATRIPARDQRKSSPRRGQRRVRVAPLAFAVPGGGGHERGAAAGAEADRCRELGRVSSSQAGENRGRPVTSVEMAVTDSSRYEQADREEPHEEKGVDDARSERGAPRGDRDAVAAATGHIAETIPCQPDRPGRRDLHRSAHGPCSTPLRRRRPCATAPGSAVSGFSRSCHASPDTRPEAARIRPAGSITGDREGRSGRSPAVAAAESGRAARSRWSPNGAPPAVRDAGERPRQPRPQPGPHGHGATIRPGSAAPDSRRRRPTQPRRRADPLSRRRTAGEPQIAHARAPLCSPGFRAPTSARSPRDTGAPPAPNPERHRNLRVGTLLHHAQANRVALP